MPLPIETEDRNPNEEDLSRRSGTPAVSPLLIVVGIALIAALIYVISALV